MSSSFGLHLSYTLFGESHGEAIGITIDGLPPGVSLDFTAINLKLNLRRGGASFNTSRNEKDEYNIISGYFNDRTTGTPFTVIFPNSDTKSSDYDTFANQPRPGHADYVARLKYNGANDPRGGGHFSGRLTTPLVFFGAIALQLIQRDYPYFAIASHIAQMQDVQDTSYYDVRQTAIAEAFNLPTEDAANATALIARTLSTDDIAQSYASAMNKIESLFMQLDRSFPVVSESQASVMQNILEATAQVQSTLGGKIETVVFHPPVALGAPFFHSIESMISTLLFSIGSVKAVSFGYGEQFVEASGITVKDEIIQIIEERVATLYNYNGGINGGISNGEDIVIATTCKPISSIGATQHTLNTATDKIEPLVVTGRHDVSIVNRIIPLIEAIVAIALYDLLLDNRK